MTIRKPAVSGKFYTGNPNRLVEEIERLTNKKAKKQKAIGIISPHAGLLYSGQVAGMVYSGIEVPGNVIILGPNHTGYGPHVSIMDSGSWQMPMGEVKIAQDIAEAIIQHSDLIQSDTSAQMLEHSLELQLPFLQYFQPALQIVPIVLGSQSFALCQEVADAIVKGIKNLSADTLIVASTDLTHYEPQEEAVKTDQRVIDRILNLDAKGLFDMVSSEGISMCGFVPVTIMILAALKMGARKAQLVKYMTSGEVSGDYSQVVGYAGMIVS